MHKYHAKVWAYDVNYKDYILKLSFLDFSLYLKKAAATISKKINITLVNFCVVQVNTKEK